tara:strand:- start:290 stop:763 length:474 start_codon:yes stop_codon:yes gene_type:complete
MSNDYVKHLIDCHCILSIYKNRTKPIYHKFPVFSILEEDSIKEKYVLCNNCDIVHKVFEINKSEIKWGNEGFKSLVTTKEDIKFNLENLGMERLVTILEVNNVDISDWELIDYLLENNLEGKVVIDKKEIEDSINYKYLEIKNGKYKIKNDIVQRYL